MPPTPATRLALDRVRHLGVAMSEGRGGEARVQVDEDIPVAKGRYLIEPMVIARLLQEARVKPTDIVLDVGACTGYASALLSRMAATVVALESDAELAARAEATLREVGVDHRAEAEQAEPVEREDVLDQQRAGEEGRDEGIQGTAPGTS